MTQSIKTISVSDADARINHLYADLRDAWARLEAVETIIVAAGSDRVPKDAAADYDALLTMVGEREDAMRKALADRVGELDHRIGVALVAQVGTLEFFDMDGAALTGDARLTDVVAARMKSEAMDDAMRRLLDLITLRRIEEATDNTSYQTRVGEAFDRLQHAACAFACRIDDPDQSGEAGRGELGILADMAAGLTTWKDTQPDGLKREFARSLISVERQVRAMSAISHALACHRDIAAAVATEFCGDRNRGHVREVTQGIATRARYRAFVAPVVAGTAAILAERALSMSGAADSLESRAPILIAIFALAFTLCCLALGACRAGRVKGLRRAMTTRLEALFEVDPAAHGQPRGRGLGGLTRRYARTIADRFLARIGAPAAERPSQRGAAFFHRVSLGRFSGAVATQPATRAVLARGAASVGLARLEKSVLSIPVIAGITSVIAISLVAAEATRSAGRVGDDLWTQVEQSAPDGASTGGTQSGELSPVWPRAAQIRALGVRGRLVRVAGRART